VPTRQAATTARTTPAEQDLDPVSSSPPRTAAATKATNAELIAASRTRHGDPDGTFGGPAVTKDWPAADDS